MEIKYIVERQMIYSLDERSMIDTVGEFDNFDDALDALDKEAYLYSNDKNVAIEVVKYKFDKFDNNIIKTVEKYYNFKYEYEYLDKLIGFYGTDAAKYLNINSKKKKYGLIVS